MKLEQASEELSNVDLLIFLLVRFPEILSINYNLAETKFTLSFMLKRIVENDQYILFKKGFLTSFKAYNEISGFNHFLPRLCKKIIKPWTLLQVTLKKERITFEEVNLISSLVLNEFKNDVVIDCRDNYYFESKINNNEYLLSRKKENEEENLIAFRESGKVYIYDK